MPTRHVLWAVLALLLAGCTPSLGAVFDATPAYPGYTWTRDGRSVKPEELGTIAGPGHCGWESATFLTIAGRWGRRQIPLRKRANTSATRVASYVDPCLIALTSTRNCPATLVRRATPITRFRST